MMGLLRKAIGQATGQADDRAVEQRRAAAAEHRLPQLPAVFRRLLRRRKSRDATLTTSAALGLVLLVGSAVFSWSTLRPMATAIETLGEQVDAMPHAGGAARVMPQEQLRGFVGGLPPRMQLPALLAVVTQQATAAGLAIDRGDYALTTSNSGMVSRYTLRFPVKGTYPQIRAFVDGTLVALPAASLDTMRLVREAVADDQLQADLSFALFVRDGQ